MTAQDPPVSVKAAVRCGDRWVVLRNDRDEWELPGGRVDPTDDTLQSTLRRECREELGVDVQIGELVDAYIFEVLPGRRVVVVCFQATMSVADGEAMTCSDEHRQIALVSLAELDDLALPPGYRRSIETCARRDTTSEDSVLPSS